MNPFPVLAEPNVNKAKQNQKNIRPRQVTLYRNVFYSRVSTTVVLCLCLSFLLQPIERIYASENTQSNTTPDAIVNLAVDAKLSQPEENVDVEIPNQVTPLTQSTPETVVEAGTTTVAAIAEPEIKPSASSTGSSEAQAPDSGGGIASTTQMTDEEIQSLITDVDKLPNAELIESTTTATTTENPIAVSTVHSDAIMQFNRNDCVTVEDGSFYCQSKKAETEQGTDGMYALQDKDGDLEIFLQKNGELSQLTFNTVDDAAPFFDSKSNSIVWHRIVNERYQIISYTLDTKEEVQLTADNVNNMEPSRSGENTVWQRWNGDNWDIVLYNGRETKFITDSPLHDIAPNIKGDLVMWNRLLPNNTQTIELYDIATGEYTTITDNEGGALSNPRMVLVYETEFANGDVVTKGYDVDTGEITPLANDPAELPEKLPEPDSTGETRALLQPKNPTKEDSEITDDLFPGIDGNPFGNGTSTASSTSLGLNGDLHIASSSPYIAGSTPNIGTSTQAVVDLTLNLAPPAIVSTDIPADLIVPPFMPETASTSVVTSE